MKKIQILALGAFVAFGAIVTSCDKSSTGGNVSLKSDMDTLSYVLGTQMAEGLTGELQQMGLYTDTATLSTSYKGRISAEADAAKKAELEKEFKHKLDSVTTANKKNLAEFLNGLNSVMNMSDDKKAYAGGLLVGSQFKMYIDNFEKQALGEGSDKKISKKLLISGLETIIHGGTSAVASPQEVLQAKMTAIQQQAQERQAAESKEKNKGNIEAGQKFLAEYKSKEGVIVTPEGIAYKVIKEGKGAKPALTDAVKVNYKGTFIDGKEFDSSAKQGQPASFQLNQVIKGWTAIMQLMPVGSKWEVVIPYELAYGEAGNQGVPPYSTLVFEIELLSTEKVKAQPQDQQGGQQQLTPEQMQMIQQQMQQQGAR